MRSKSNPLALVFPIYSLAVPLVALVVLGFCNIALAQQDSFDTGLNYLTLQQQQQAAQAQEQRARQTANDPFRPFERSGTGAALSPTDRAVPARELDFLTEAVSIGDQRATLRVQDGRIVSETQRIPEADNAEAGKTEADSPENAQTLDAQIEGRNIRPDDNGSVQQSSAPQNNNSGVGRAAVIDRSQGAKVNIISNTDTGVRLGE